MKIKRSLFQTTAIRLIFSSAIYLLCSNVAVAQSLADFALGGRNICAIDSNGNLECTTRFDADTFLPPADGTLYKAVSSGIAHSCAITQSGNLRCWGLNDVGQLNAPSTGVGFVSLSAMGHHTCAVDANKQVSCWGLNMSGQTDVPEPNSGFLSVHTGEASSCGVKESGELVCWTSNTQITNNIPDAPSYTDVVLSDGWFGKQSCGLTQDGSIDCWAGDSLSVEVPTSGPYTQIGADSHWLCGLTQDGVLDCNYKLTSLNNIAINAANQTLSGEIASLPKLSKFEVLTQSSTITSMCGLTLEGRMVCVGSSLPANTLPGFQDMALEEINTLENLDFAIYSDTTVELFWNNSDVHGQYSGTNIYRDNTLLTLTSNGTSFIDDTLAAGQQYTYTVALVDIAGFEGPLSAPIQVVTNNSGQVDPGGDTDVPAAQPSQASQPTNINIARYGNSSLEIFWDKPSSITDASYQIYRNGEFLATAFGPSFYDQSINAATAYFYTIVVVERAGDAVVGVGFVNESALSGQ